MKKVLVLCQHFGENAPTARSPIAEWVGQVDLSEKVSRCVSFDFDMLCMVDLYEVREIEIPEWMDIGYWIVNQIALKFAVAVGVDLSWPQAWVEGLIAQDNTMAYACSKLLATKKFRSDFRKSVRDQVVAHLESGAKGSPMSWNQLSAILGPYGDRAVKQATNGAYWHRNEPGVKLDNDAAMAAVAKKAA